MNYLAKILSYVADDGVRKMMKEWLEGANEGAP
jgi:hypothetical protein